MCFSEPFLSELHSRRLILAVYFPSPGLTPQLGDEPVIVSSSDVDTVAIELLLDLAVRKTQRERRLNVGQP